MSLHDRIEARPGGHRALAAARLARTVEVCLYDVGGELPRRWFRRVSARRLSVTELAGLLESAGYELDVRLVPYGELRRRALEGEA